MEKRNYGIDMLRITCMLMIIILHILGGGGILETVDKMSRKYEVAWLLEIICYCAVNCFAIISGYVGVRTKNSLSKVIYLWFVVFFYTFVLTIIFLSIYPEKNDLEHWLRVLFPVSTSQYWYFSAYFPMSLFIPFFNDMLNVLSEKKLMVLGVTIIGVFSLWQTFVAEDFFGLKDGYSVLWLLLLYLLGGIIYRTRNVVIVNKKMGIVVWLVCSLITWGWKYVVEIYSFSRLDENVFVNYTSPTMVIGAIGLLYFFAGLDIKNSLLKRHITIGAPCAFSVYLIHTQVYIYSILWVESFAFLTKFSLGYMAILVVTIAFVIYVICTIIDLVRIKIFEIIKVRNISVLIEKKIYSLWESLLGRE